MSVQTKYLGDIRCVCGKHGKLEADLRRWTTSYSVRHYKRYGVGWSDHDSKYTGICYIGDKFKLGVSMP